MEKTTEFTLNVWHEIDRSPRIEREMSKEMWAEYRSNMDALTAEMRAQACEFEADDKYYTLLTERSTVSRVKLNMPLQNSQKFSEIPYRAVNSTSKKTIATSGNFPLVTKEVLEHFGKSISLKDLIRIALYGDWIAPEGGTYWHFIDTVCYAYHLNCKRISMLSDVLQTLQHGDGIVIALLANKLFPNGLGRHLAVVRGVVKGKVIMQSTSKVGYESVTLKEFFENCDVIWSICG